MILICLTAYYLVIGVYRNVDLVADMTFIYTFIELRIGFSNYNNVLMNLQLFHTIWCRHLMKCFIKLFYIDANFRSCLLQLKANNVHVLNFRILIFEESSFSNSLCYITRVYYFFTLAPKHHHSLLRLANS